MADVTILFIPSNIGESTHIYKEYSSTKLNIFNFVDTNIDIYYKNNIILYNNNFKKITKYDKIKHHIFNNECIIFICTKKKHVKIKCNLLHKNINHIFHYMYPINITDKEDISYSSVIYDLFIYLNKKCNTLVSKKADTYLTLNNSDITVNTKIKELVLVDSIYNLNVVYSDKLPEIIDLINILDTDEPNEHNNSVKTLIDEISDISFEELLNEIKKEILDPKNPLKYKNYTTSCK